MYPSARDAAPAGALRVLVVDDHGRVRAAVASLLRRADGLVVVGSAGDGHEAVALAGELGPDVVLMDVSMPRMGGADATRALIERGDAPPVVAFTASASLAREALSAGAVGCVFKDAPAAELIAAVEEAANIRG